MTTIRAQGNLDIFTILIEFFSIIMLAWIGTLIYTGFTSGSQGLAAAPIVTNSPIASNTIRNGSSLFSGLNNILSLAFIFLCLGSIIAAFFTDSHPALAFVGILLSPIAIFISFGLHDVFFSIIQSSSYFGALATQYPLTTLMFQYLPVMTFIFAVLIAIVTFGKNQ